MQLRREKVVFKFSLPSQVAIGYRGEVTLAGTSDSQSHPVHSCQEQRETECVNAHTQFDFSRTVWDPAQANVLPPFTLGFPTSISICMTVCHRRAYRPT